MYLYSNICYFIFHFTYDAGAGALTQIQWQCPASSICQTAVPHPLGHETPFHRITMRLLVAPSRHPSPRC